MSPKDEQRIGELKRLLREWKSTGLPMEAEHEAAEMEIKAILAEQKKK